MSGRTVRILITGSRDFKWPRVVHWALDRYRATLAPGDTLVVVHGRCRKGADLFADGWAHHHERHPDPEKATVRNEPHRADWLGPCRAECVGEGGHGRRRKSKDGSGRTYCPAAGDYRNDEMVLSRPDRALIFILDNSNGTMDCFMRIMAAHIPWEGFGAYTPTEATAPTLVEAAS